MSDLILHHYPRYPFVEKVRLIGPDPSTGERVAATRMHYTPRRVDQRAGLDHVHFPRIVYVMRAVRTW